MTDLDLDELRAELDEFAQPEKKGGRSSREARIIAGFEEIQRFIDTHGRVPPPGAAAPPRHPSAPRPSRPRRPNTRRR